MSSSTVEAVCHFVLSLLYLVQLTYVKALSVCMRCSWRILQGTRSSPSPRPGITHSASRLAQISYSMWVVLSALMHSGTLTCYTCSNQYNDPAAVSQIREATKDSLHYALDTISTESSQIFTVNVFGPGPGELVIILQPEEKAEQLRPDVHVQGMHSPLQIFSLTNGELLWQPPCSTLYSAASSTFTKPFPHRPKTMHTWPSSCSRCLSWLPPAG